MKVGEVITFQRESQPSTGYRWYVSHLENFALLDEELEYDPDDGNKAGKSGTQRFTLQAIQAGTAKVQFAKYRPFEPGEVLYDEILPFNVEGTVAANSPLEQIPGGWNSFVTVKDGDDAHRVFNEAAASLHGVDYTPLLVASQTVKGTNYIFVANGKVVYHSGRTYGVLLLIYKEPDKDARLVEIKKIGHPTFKGAYGEFGELTVESSEALAEAQKLFAGSDFTPCAVATQIVAGRNYRFAGNINPVTKNPSAYPALVTVYKPLKGEAKVTEIRKAYELSAKGCFLGWAACIGGSLIQHSLYRP
ncbi:MAG: protease inhibitor I42 family protein [Treponema sp.]|jgi:predicted secreted protein|nr:protease inhibitor I42 family protein [Treponema sp.]